MTPFRSCLKETRPGALARLLSFVARVCACEGHLESFNSCLKQGWIALLSSMLVWSTCRKPLFMLMLSGAGRSAQNQGHLVGFHSEGGGGDTYNVYQCSGGTPSTRCRGYYNTQAGTRIATISANRTGIMPETETCTGIERCDYSSRLTMR